MKKIFIFTMLLMLICISAWAQPTPSNPPSAQSLGLQEQQPSQSVQAPPASESGQLLIATTEASAMSAAPTATAMAVAPDTRMIVPPGVSAPNLFYIPYYPSTVASCNFGQWISMYLDISGSGPLYSYEWYPDGRLISKQLTYVPYPSWQKMWFYGDAPGWHTLQYYCNGWSNYVYAYVYGGAYTPGPTPPTPSCQSRIVVTSPMAGFSVYVDGGYVGGDGQGGDPLDGYYAFNVAGNQAHTINVVYKGGSYTQTKTYNCGNTYTLTVGSSSKPSPPPQAMQPISPPMATQPLPPPMPVLTPY
jgi:hypothetical protein